MATIRIARQFSQVGVLRQSRATVPQRCAPFLSQNTTFRHASFVKDNLPRVAQPSLWKSMIPKFMRRDEESLSVPTKVKDKEWNPATFFIIIFLLIGSNAINLIALRRELVTFSRQAEQKIARLSEVIEKVKNGEKVDVEAMLGTGNAEQELEWEEVLRELQQPQVFQPKETKDRVQLEGSVKDQSVSDSPQIQSSHTESAPSKPQGRPAFY